MVFLESKHPIIAVRYDQVLYMLSQLQSDINVRSNFFNCLFIASMTMKPFGTDSAFFQDQDIKKCMCPNFRRAQFLFGVFGERILITLSRKSARPNILGQGHNHEQNLEIRCKLKMNAVATSLSQTDSRIALDTKAIVDL